MLQRAPGRCRHEISRLVEAVKALLKKFGQNGPVLDKKRQMVRLASGPEENQPNYQEHGQHVWNCVSKNVGEEVRRVNLLLIGDCLDHEVRRIADVGIGTE